ncbi:hypothetical protein M404DRAFT_1006693 [Pisolithus tinctorius Marx 270]|uniref:Uncharacterized protein n=1 Tax=Pisolithus tinctorius Marx 270 TaxID=870435 RepID=A0A0C3NMV6_PISTI|nr:hypothetical protein M404DRAFT_1006693 [Pisolithus tinctorius Marx 270]
MHSQEQRPIAERVMKAAHDKRFTFKGEMIRQRSKKLGLGVTLRITTSHTVQKNQRRYQYPTHNLYWSVAYMGVIVF